MARLLDVRMPESDAPAGDSAVAQWLKQLGDRVTLHEPLLEVNTDKVVMEVSSPASGILREILKTSGDAVAARDVLGRIEPFYETDQEVVEEGPRKAAPPRQAQKPLAPGQRLSPAVRRLLKEHGLESSQIEGSGRGGRITQGDVQAFLRGHAKKAPEQKAKSGGSRRIPHTPMRRAIAAHMVESLLRTAPHVTTVFEADFSAIERSRQALQADFKERGVRLTYTAYLVAAAAKALQEVPEVNSTWRDDALEIFEDCNIGVATALGQGGLIVPVIQKAHRLTLFETASRLQQLTELAREGRLKSGDLEGGTFTITNHGVSGSLIATPIIHQPQSAILGIGKVQKRLVVMAENGEESIRIRPMAYVTLTLDHRALDGFTANLFLAKFVQQLENWS